MIESLLIVESIDLFLLSGKINLLFFHQYKAVCLFPPHLSLVRFRNTVKPSVIPFRQQKEDGGNRCILCCQNEERRYEDIWSDCTGSPMEDDWAGPEGLLQHVWRGHHGSGIQQLTVTLSWHLRINQRSWTQLCIVGTEWIFLWRWKIDLLQVNTNHSASLVIVVPSSWKEVVLCLLS